MITGKDVIMFILKYDLVNEKIFADGIIDKALVHSSKVAEYFGVGVATIKAMYEMGTLHGFEIDGELYFPRAILNTKGDAKVNEK